MMSNSIQRLGNLKNSTTSSYGPFDRLENAKFKASLSSNNPIRNGAVATSELMNSIWSLSQTKPHPAESSTETLSSFKNTSHAKFILGTLSRIGSVVEATTGLISAGKALKYDIKKGDTSYKNTMLSIFKSVAKSSASYGVGTMVTAGAAATLSGSVIIPVTIGVGAAIGTGFLIDQAFQSI